MGGRHTLLDPLGLAGIFKKQQTSGAMLNGVNLQSSSYGGALPLCYGTTRIPGNMVDYDDFTQIASNQSMGKGGSVATSYTYTAGAILALCEGPLTVTTAVPYGINRVWLNGSEQGAQGYSPVMMCGLTVKIGVRPQTAWSVWTSKHPAKAIGYAGMALVCNDTFALGDSGTMPQWAFEVQGLLATEPDSGSLITLGLGTGSQTTFIILDENGNQITDSTTPPWSGYYNPSFYLNGVLQATGVTVTKNAGGYYQVTFSSAPALSVVIAWNGTQALMADAMPSNILVDFLTNAQHGAGWTTGRISSLITGCPFMSGASAITAWCNANPGTWQAYCSAMGWAVSPCWDTQRAATESLQELLTATNSEAVWTAGQYGCVLNVVPYGDTAVTGNGVTYTPNTTPLYALTYDDFLGAVDAHGAAGGDDPVEVTRTAIADVYNTWPVEWWDRLSAYNVSTVQSEEPVDVALHGTKVASGTTMHLITRRAHALALSRVLAQRSVYLRNQYTFKVGWKYILVEPMDLLSISDPLLGLSGLIVRVLSVTFPEKKSEADGIEITAEAWPFGVGSPVLYATVNTSTAAQSQTLPPGNCYTPVIAMLPALATQTGDAEVVIATSGGPQWGGCEVWLSYDGTTYNQVGVIQGNCRCGTLTATCPTTGTAYPNVDTSSTLAILQQSAYQRTLSTISAAVAADLNGLLWVGSTGADSELIGYTTATLTGSQAYSLTNLYRGAYGSSVSAHTSGDSWVLLDGTPLQITVPTSRVGQTVYFKFLSFNNFGQALQAISAVSAVSFVVPTPNYPQPIGVVMSTPVAY